MQRLEEEEANQAERAQANQERIAKAIFDTDRIAWQAGQTLADGLTTAIFAGDSLSDVFKGLIEDIAQMIVKALIFRAIMDSLGAAGVGPLAFGDGGVVPAAKGRVIPFAKGSVVNKRTIFPFAGGTGIMGEEGAEAIMPLLRDRKGRLGVSAEGGGGEMAMSQQVIIENHASDVNVREERRTNANGQQQVVIMVENELAGRIGRGEGKLGKAIQNRFGVRNSPVSR
jgi:phage-related minor tail protein